VSDLNFIIDTQSGEDAPTSLRALPHKSLVETLYKEADKFNAKLPLARRVPAKTVEAIISREETHPNAMRALGQYFNTIENPQTPAPTTHRDLLPRNHPLSTKWVSQFSVRESVATYFESDTRVEDHETRALIASALSYEPDSAQRHFYNEVLTAKTNDVSLLANLDEADRMIEERKKIK
jgi:hypothetical protein